MPNVVTLHVRDMTIEASVAGEPGRPALLLLHGWPQMPRALFRYSPIQLLVWSFHDA